MSNRLIELVDRLIAPGPKAAHVSASECHEIADEVHELLNQQRCREADQRRGHEIEDNLAYLEAHKEFRETVRHIAYVEIDLASCHRGGSCRTAACLCGWKGPQRMTLEVAVDDAVTHEHTNSNGC